MLGRFGKDAGSLVGLEIASDAVRILQVQQRNRRWRVVGSAQEPLHSPLGDDWRGESGLVVAALQRAYRRSGVRQRRVALALPANQVICKLCHLPGERDGAEMEVQLLADAERLFPFPLEDLALDFQALGPSRVQPGCLEVMVAACRQSALASLATVVEEAGLELAAVEVDNIALSRMLPQGCMEGSALLRLETRSVTLYGWQPGKAFLRVELPQDELRASGQLPEHLQALFAEAYLPAQLWVASSALIDPGWLQGLSEQLELPCRQLPGLAGLEQVDGSMLLAGALSVGGWQP